MLVNIIGYPKMQVNWG